MRTVDAVAEILKREGVEYLPCFPTTPVIEACAAAGIRPIVCRQERVGVGIADGYSRVTNGTKPGVFACQYGPGAENAYSGVATAFSDSVPMMLLPMGNVHDLAGVEPHFNSRDSYGSVVKRVEEVNTPDRVAEVMRRAFSSVRMGRPGPVMVEIPGNVGTAEVDESAWGGYRPVKTARSAADSQDIDQAARVLLEARAPIVHAGQGVMYAEACEELIELAELLQIPVMTTLAGKSAFPEKHPLALGAGSGVMPAPVYQFLRDADVVFGIGTSFTKHGMCTNIPSGKVMIHATNDETDINKCYDIDYPVVGDAKLVLRQLIDAVRDRLKRPVPSSVTTSLKRSPSAVRHGLPSGCPSSPPTMPPSTPIAFSGTSCTLSTPTRLSSPMTPAVPATRSFLSIRLAVPAPTLAGASPTASAPAWASISEQNSPLLKKCASTSWATPPSA